VSIVRAVVPTDFVIPQPNDMLSVLSGILLMIGDPVTSVPLTKNETEVAAEFTTILIFCHPVETAVPLVVGCRFCRLQLPQTGQ